MIAPGLIADVVFPTRVGVDRCDAAASMRQRVFPTRVGVDR